MPSLSSTSRSASTSTHPASTSLTPHAASHASHSAATAHPDTFTLNLLSEIENRISQLCQAKWLLSGVTEPQQRVASVAPGAGPALFIAPGALGRQTLYHEGTARARTASPASTAAVTPPPARRLSAAGREAIAEGQRRRWRLKKRADRLRIKLAGEGAE